MVIESKSILETLTIANKLASLLTKGDVIVLNGELRSWKNKIY